MEWKALESSLDNGDAQMFTSTHTGITFFLDYSRDGWKMTCPFLGIHRAPLESAALQDAQLECQQKARLAAQRHIEILTELVETLAPH